MLVVVCLNPAIDVTFTVDELLPGSTHRVQASRQRAGGKGVNVAHVLHQLGAPVVLTGLVGGRRGTAVSTELAAGLTARLVEVADETRRTVTVVDRTGRASVFNEPGPVVSAAEWTRFTGTFAALVGEAEVVVLSGSLPPGVPSDAYAQLTRIAHAAQLPSLVDAAGDALRDALPAGPELVKPNEHEAAPHEGVDGLLRAGARNAVVSRGADGLTAAVGGRRYEVSLDAPVAGNPTGAGDALAAGLAYGLRGRDPDWPDVLREATALAAASVAVPYAGAFDPDVLAAVRPLVQVKEI